MSSYDRTIIEENETTNFITRVRVFFALNPEWWVWVFCLFIWSLLLSVEVFVHSPESTYVRVLTCSHLGFSESDMGLLKEGALQPSFLSVFGQSLISWVIMIFAMMFPLLRKSIRHVAISVRKKDREFGVTFFLVGYTVVWMIGGILYVSIPFLFERIPNIPSMNLSLVLSAVLLIVVALKSWHPSREVVMMQCEVTIPIRIFGWSFVKDAFRYGLKIGWACFKMCWLAMLALVIAHHSLLLMAVFSIIVLTERYFVPHNSRLVGYAWMTLAAVMMVISFI